MGRNQGSGDDTRTIPMSDKRNGSPTFYALLADMANLHDRKSHDYANNTDPSGNYRFAGTIANMFSYSPLDAGFAGRLAEKIYRLSVLEGSGKEPKNESIDDTEQDIAVITVLWMASRRDERKKPNPLETELFDLIKLMPDFQTEKIISFINEMREIRKMSNQAVQSQTTARELTPSEEACCRIIEFDAKLTPADRAQMISYLTNCQRDALSPKL